ncbi:hypothetical protein EVAR_59704_1 [Eumeta japonica]|uniref:Ku domain-containing protein n=1 Tax=Eumeta variegata TaxID=151549 RepID=A0A4C1ZG20_EUMVA|nr:hypothetical protein EVAR_59704_1 [Eumeta japonica]
MDSDDEIDMTTWKGIPGSIILINIFDSSQLNASVISFEAVLKLIKQNLRSNSRVIGVCLYGTKCSGTSTLAVPSVVQLLPLAVPTIEDYKKMKSESVTTYDQANDLKLSEVFWHCSKMFANCKRILSDRSIYILTRLDIPPIETDRRPTKKRIVDLIGLGINVKIINISENVYDIHPFYHELLQMICLDDVIIPEPIYKIDDIVELMQQNSHRHLAMARLKFQIGENFSIGVGVYKLCKSYGMPKKINLNQDNNDIVKSDNSLVKVARNVQNENVEEMMKVPLLKSELLYYQEYGNERIEFAPEELNQIKNPFGPPTMKLLGFKPKNILCKEKWFLKECAFLFPNEDVIEGSTIAFKALHSACIEMSVIAICILCARTTTKPRIVALSPCVKPFNLSVEIGFDIIYIPNLENLKDVPNNNEDEPINFDETSASFMRDLVNTLKFDYNAETFQNPKLQYFYRALEALALDEQTDEPIDTTIRERSELESIDSEMFYQLFGSFDSTTTKRPTSSKNGGPVSKKKVFNIDENLLQERIRSSKVMEYTVSELKDIIKYLKPNGPGLTGVKKDKLVAYVYEYGKDVF